jgi:RNA polymerase sigma-70 factor (ECF subfamily)
MTSAEPAALFDQLYAEHAVALHAYLLARVGDQEAAHDLLQEIALRLWRHLPVVRALPPERRRFWLFGVARNAVTDHYRRRAVRQAAERPLDDATARTTAAPSDAPRQVETADEVRRLDAAIGALPEDLRAPLLLQTLAGLSSREIGATLALPPGTVRYKIAQARRQLAGALGLLANPAPLEERHDHAARR